MINRHPKRVCKRCLLQEAHAEYFESLRLYIESIDQDLKVDNDTYENRLNICKDCPHLYDGMCKGCGCYVELRGVMKRNSCPYNKWLAVPSKK